MDLFGTKLRGVAEHKNTQITPRTVFHQGMKLCVGITLFIILINSEHYKTRCSLSPRWQFQSVRVSKFTQI